MYYFQGSDSKPTGISGINRRTYAGITIRVIDQPGGTNQEDAG
jgi:hypothetical protein